MTASERLARFVHELSLAAIPLDTRELSSNVNLVAKSSIGPVKNTFLLGADYDVVADKARIDVGLVGLVDFANPAFPSYTTPVTPVLNADNTYQNSGLTKPSVRASLRLSIEARRHAAASMRSVSRSTNNATADRAATRSSRASARSTRQACRRRSPKANRL